MSRESALLKFTGDANRPKPTSIHDVVINKEEAKVNEEQPSTEETHNQEAATPKTDLDASRIAILAKKEASIQKEREAFKKEREEFLKEKAIAEEYKKKGQEFDELAKKDKIAALKMIGWSETDILNAMSGMEQAEPTPEEKAERIAQAKIDEFEKKLKAKEEETERTNNERLIKSLKTDITTQIKEQAEKYEFCSFEGAAGEEQAYQFIAETLKETGELISVEEALDMTEALYEERAKALTKLKKLQPKVEEAPVVEEPPQRGRVPVSNVPQPTPEKKAAVIPPPPPGRRETHSEKKERLIQAIKTHGLRR